jgi:hypothetical protein
MVRGTASLFNYGRDTLAVLTGIVYSRNNGSTLEITARALCRCSVDPPPSGFSIHAAVAVRHATLQAWNQAS